MTRECGSSSEPSPLGCVVATYDGNHFTEHDLLYTLTPPRPWRNGPENRGTYTNLIEVLAHELGHAGGLGHSKVPETVMYTGRLTYAGVLTSYDVDAMKAIYNTHGNH